MILEFMYAPRANEAERAERLHGAPRGGLRNGSSWMDRRGRGADGAVGGWVDQGSAVSTPRPRRTCEALPILRARFACTRDGTVGLRNIRSASVERDFYTYLNDTGRPTDTVEHWFGEEIENSVAAVLRSLQSAPELQAERGVLPSFVVSSLLRTATVRSFMDQIDQHLRPLLVLQDQARKAGIDLAALTDAERRRLLDATKDTLTRVAGDPEEEHKSRLRTMLRKIDEWTTTIKGWNWEISRAPAPILITGDAPIVVIGAVPLQGWAGVLPADSTIAIPINPTALLTVSPLPLMGTGTVTDQLATQLNNELVRNCFKAVFHHPETPWPSAL